MADIQPGIWTVERLARHHERSDFDCGLAVLNEWLKLRAGQFEKRDLSRTYVAIRPGSTTVVGFYALANHCVRYDALSATEAKGLPRMDMPVVLLGKLAVDRQVQGQRLGEYLLMDALRRIQKVSEEVGVRAVEVHALNESARRFYLRYGFTELTDDPVHLFLPIHIIRSLPL